ncbi:hypothetical protein [Novispirillum itersonii]|uniref:Uncharacterized protein n=1 Tax=Novispirillum itersonii TaxID=189 RepID=A0A7X0DPJ0_NOVIT|nr:hypothetical protein [Novispirillum itersonii]MBB6212419.1 hypothetical protein [Novispirillum itersonii]
MTIPLYREQATRVLGLSGLNPTGLDPWTLKSIDWLTMFMLSAKPGADSTAPESRLPAVRGILCGQIRAIEHINRMAETPPPDLSSVTAFVHTLAVQMQETPEMERESILRFINGHLALWEDLHQRPHQRPAMPRKGGS